MAMPPPKIDERNLQTILQEIRLLAPFYVPEWNAGLDRGPGAVIQQVFARLLEGLLQRLNEVPQRNFIEFLNLLGFKLLPAQPARAPLTFLLSNGANEPVAIPRRTQVAGTPPEGGDPLIFETGSTILATPARLAAIFTAIPKRDEIFDHLTPLQAGKTTVLFGEEENLQEHSLYLSHGDLFNLKGPAVITLNFTGVTPRFPDQVFRNEISWEWWNEDHWVPSTVPAFKSAGLDFPALTKLDMIDENIVRVVNNVENDERFPATGLLLIDEEIIRYVKKCGNEFRGSAEIPLQRGFGSGDIIPGAGLPKSHAAGEDVCVIDHPFLVDISGNSAGNLFITLTKNFDTKFSKSEINGTKNIWLRIRPATSPLLKTSPIANLQLDTIQVNSSSFAGGNNPDALFQNDVSLQIPDPDAVPPISIYPFGKIPRTFNGFYIASDDAFSKSGAQITLHITSEVDILTEIPIERVQGIGETFKERLIAQDPAIDTVEKLLEKDLDNLMTILETNRLRTINIVEAAQKMFYDKTGRFSSDIPGGNGIGPDPELAWEYWDGKGWKALRELTDQTNKLRANGIVTFPCPADSALLVVGGQEHYWIRTRIVDGDYGREKFTVNGNVVTSDLSEVHPPLIRALKVDYKPHGECPPHGQGSLEQCLILNNLNYTDQVKASRTSGQPFQPFQVLDDIHQALYWGFDRPPVKGPISILISLVEQEYLESNLPRLTWQYFRKGAGTAETGEWARLEVQDGTRNLTESGVLVFTGPPDFEKLKRFGKSLYWVRAINAVNEFQERMISGTAANDTTSTPPCLTLDICDELLNSFHPRFTASRESLIIPALPKSTGFYLNTVMAEQTETIQEEIVGSGNGRIEQTYNLNKFPVISEEIQINEFGILSEGERKALKENKTVQTREVKDEAGNVSEFWIMWRPIDDLIEASETDRVYEIDRTFGTIKFGNKVNGMVPPLGRDNIIANYRAGGGLSGNLSRDIINNLRTTIPLVDSVRNPEPAGGGSNTELVANSLERGPLAIKNRGRAVTVEDFESLAKEASGNVARAKCIARLNDSGARESNWVTVIIVPDSPDERPFPSPQLRQGVEKYLRERAANVVTFPGHLQVTGPTYVSVSVAVDIFPVTIDLSPDAEREALRRTADFLHPLTGGMDGSGWEFGRLPCLSDFYSLLEAIESVDHVENLSLALQAISASGETLSAEIVDESRPLNAQMPEYTLVFSGKHTVNLR